MYESKENGRIRLLDKDNIYGIYEYFSKDKYTEIENVFFKNGVNYKDKILIFKESVFNELTRNIFFKYINENIIYEIIFEVNNSLLGDGTLYFRNFLEIEFHLPLINENSSLEIKNINNAIIEVIELDFYKTNGFYVKFKLKTHITDVYVKTIFENTNFPFGWTLEQYKIQPEGNFLSNPPVMDCSDYISFFWALLNYNYIIKEKIFDNNYLIENKFENINFIEKIDKNLSYKKILKELYPQDIVIFKGNFTNHSIFILDPKNEIYSENSGYIEYNLGINYNGKRNPYPLETRFNHLTKDNNIYICRLYV